jgi:hypothetical protein
MFIMAHVLADPILFSSAPWLALAQVNQLTPHARYGHAWHDARNAHRPCRLKAPQNLLDFG